MSTSKYKLKKFKIINKYKNKRSAEEPYRWNKLKKVILNFCTFYFIISVLILLWLSAEERIKNYYQLMLFNGELQ